MKTFYDPTRQLDGVAADIIQTGGKQRPLGFLQDIHSASTVKNYDLGTRWQMQDRVFRYCLAGAALSRFIGAFNNNAWPLNAALTVAVTAGDTTMSVPETTAAVNEYAGGYIALFSSPLQLYRILSNTVSDGTDMVITLETPVKTTCAIGVWATGYKNIYADLRNITTGAVGFGTVMAVPVCTVASGSYFWGQTWGPCYGVADGTVPGTVVSEREVFFAQSGNLEPYADSGAGNGQLAGYLIPHTANGSGDQFYILTLAP